MPSDSECSVVKTCALKCRILLCFETLWTPTPSRWRQNTGRRHRALNTDQESAGLCSCPVGFPSGPLPIWPYLPGVSPGVIPGCAPPHRPKGGNAARAIQRERLGTLPSPPSPLPLEDAPAYPWQQPSPHPCRALPCCTVFHRHRVRCTALRAARPVPCRAAPNAAAFAASLRAPFSFAPPSRTAPHRLDASQQTRPPRHATAPLAGVSLT